MSTKRMFAVILVGGEGTRLRPLTYDRPKPIIEFLNKPILTWQIECFKEAGITDIILCIGYKPDKMAPYLESVQHLGVNIICSVEGPELMGTAGPLKIAEEHLRCSDVDHFFCINGDMVCDFPLTHALKYFREQNKHKPDLMGCLMTRKVSDPSRYGVIVKEGEYITKFVEKPSEFVSDMINAGVYILKNDILDLIPANQHTMLEKIFPTLSGNLVTYPIPIERFWKDLGKPEEILEGNKMYIDILVKNNLKDKDQCELDDSILFKQFYNNSNIMIKNTLIHKDCLDLIMNLNNDNSVWLEHCSIKGIEEIRGHIKLENVVIYYGFKYVDKTKKNINQTIVNTKNIKDKIIHWNSSINYETVITSGYIVKIE